MTTKHKAAVAASLPARTLAPPWGESPAKYSAAIISARMRQISRGAEATEKNRLGTRFMSSAPSSTQRLRWRHRTMSKAMKAMTM